VVFRLPCPGFARLSCPFAGVRIPIPCVARWWVWACALRVQWFVLLLGLLCSVLDFSRTCFPIVSHLVPTGRDLRCVPSLSVCCGEGGGGGVGVAPESYAQVVLVLHLRGLLVVRPCAYTPCPVPPSCLLLLRACSLHLLLFARLCVSEPVCAPASAPLCVHVSVPVCVPVCVCVTLCFRQLDVGLSLRRVLKLNDVQVSSMEVTLANVPNLVVFEARRTITATLGTTSSLVWSIPRRTLPGSTAPPPPSPLRCDSRWPSGIAWRAAHDCLLCPAVAELHNPRPWRLDTFPPPPPLLHMYAGCVAVCMGFFMSCVCACTFPAVPSAPASPLIFLPGC
jgi:hypothetical protein